MFKKFLIGLVILAAGFAVFVAMQPSEFSVSRNAVISASPAVVFAQVNDLRKWDAWSPWVNLDPDAKETFEGPSSGTGAKFSWAGGMEVGEGSMTITESRPAELIRLRLDFIKPFAGTSDVEFTFKPGDGQTVVTWSMSGKNNFIAKAVSLFMNCEKMIGEKYEQGLANLKSVAETAAKNAVSPTR